MEFYKVLVTKHKLGIKFGTTKEGIKRCIKEEVKKYIEEHKLDLGM
jgi:hypothetical protein